MRTSIHYTIKGALVLSFLLFIGITSSFGQFYMGNTFAPLPENQYPIVYSNDVKGGHHQVANITARNEIYTERRQIGMLCTVLNYDGSGNMKTYQLVGGIENADWQEFSVNATTTDVIKVGSSAPTPAVSGDVYYNTTDNQFREYNGSAWVVVSSVPTGGALPGTAAEGDIFYNTTDHKLYFYNGTAWTELGGATIADNTISASKLQGSDGNALGTGTSGWLLQSDGTGKFSWLDASGGLPVDASSITLASGSFLVGGAGGTAAATAKNLIPLSGFGAATADVAMGNQKITGLATPTEATDAATMGYVDGKTLDGLSNVNIGTKANNDLLQWNGSNWINRSITDAGLDQSATNEGSLTATQSGNKATIVSNTSGSKNLTIQAAGSNTLSLTNSLDPTEGTIITITGATSTDETQFLTIAGTSEQPIIELTPVVVGGSDVGGGSVTLEGGPGTTLSTSGTVITISAAGVTDLSYNVADHTVLSSTGDDAILTMVDATNPGLMSSADKTKLDAITNTGSGQIITDVERTKLSGLTNYTLPTASTTTLGGVKIDGTSVTIDGNGVISAQGVAAVQSELDATQTGAGLATDGAYSANASTNYLQTATSLKDADEKLDTQIKAVADAVATKGDGTVTEVKGTANRISVTEGTTVPVVDIASTYAGQSSITTLGTVTTGIWNGSVIAPTYGGTGVNNGTNTITLGGNLTTTVGNVQLNSASGGSTVTLPSTGTLVSTTDLAAGVSPIGSTLNSGKIIVGSSENKAAAVDMSGDATIDDAGALTIEDARVTAAKLTAGAGAADRVAVADATGAVTYGSLPAGALPSSIDATKIGNGTVSSTEFQTLSDINTGQTIQTQLDSKASQSELDATQAGAGLETDGSYSANAGTNYLQAAASLKDADEKLDAQIKTVSDAVGGITSNATHTGEVTGDVALTITNSAVTTLKIADANVTAAKLTAGAGAADRVAVADATGAVTYGSLPAGALPSSIDATKIGNGTVSSTEFQTLSDINTGQTIQTQLDSKASQSELDATQAGAGLETDGSYSANASTNYLKTAASLKDADEKLDTQIKAIADGYVPYTGATGNVDLGTNNIIANSIRLTSGAQNGYILKSDGSGNASWQAATSAYKGTWNADTNTPAIADGTGSTGDYYLVSVSGTQFGRSFVQGGQAVYNGTIWESIATSQAVSSVNGLTGAVQINPGLSGNTLSLTGGTLTVDLSTATAVAAATTKGTDLQSELDATQTGAGLATTGAYAANASTNYLQTATSLKDADEKLDTQIKTVADAVATKGDGTVTEVQGTANRISVTDGTTVPVVDIASTYAGQSSITTLGTVTTGTWNGSVIAPAYGGTGVDNGTSTITLGGNLSTVGANSLTFTTTGPTNITLPTSGTLMTSANSFANPTGTIGLIANDGSATTAMRSDATPALSQEIAPTWTGVHTFSAAPVLSTANASQALFTDESKNVVSNPITGTGSVVMSTSPTFTNQVTLGTATGTTAGTIVLHDGTSGTSYTATIKAPTAITNPGYTLTLPAAAPTVDGQVLSGTTGGVLSWASAATGTVKNVETGTGLTGGPITETGTIKMADMAALSVKGNATNASAAPTDIAAGTDGHVLRRSGTTLGFGAVATAGIADNAVDGTKINLTSNAIGDLMYYDGNNWVRLPAGTAGQTLQSNGDSAPTWESISTDVFNASLTELPNGSRTVFSLSGTSTFITGTTRVYLNGLRLKQGANVGVGYYQETGNNQITFSVAPLTNDVIIVDYKH